MSPSSVAQGVVDLHEHEADDNIGVRFAGKTQKADSAGVSFWSALDYDAVYWEKYLNYRPKYSRAFYNHIIAYHYSHQSLESTFSPQPRVAHDIGTGPGQVASYLAHYFDEIVASDPNQSHLDAAQVHLADSYTTDIELVACKGEDIAQHSPPASADLVAVAECIPLLDAQAGLTAWWNILRPGGTLAVWFYGRPHFITDHIDPSFDAKRANELYNTVASAAWKPLYNINPSNPRYEGMKQSLMTLDSRLANIALDPEYWTDIHRIQFNHNVPLSMANSEDLMDGVKRSFCINPRREKIHRIEDEMFWNRDWTSNDIEEFINISMPSGMFNPTAAMRKDLKELETIMGGKDKKRTVTWGCALILATKK